jgi:hypothetical protein
VPATQDLQPAENDITRMTNSQTKNSSGIDNSSSKQHHKK